MTKKEVETLRNMVLERLASVGPGAEAKRCMEASEQLWIAAAAKGETRVHYVKAALHSFRFGR